MERTYPTINAAGHLCAEITDGASAWSQFVKSVGTKLTGNDALLQLVLAGIGLVAVAVLLTVANTRLAHWIERVWRRRQRGSKQNHTRARPGPGRTVRREAHPEK